MLQEHADKTYDAVLRLGIKTSTGDAEGEVINERPVCVTTQDVAAAVQRLTGVVSQMPPMYSALKKDGKALYEYARAGMEVERAARDITVHELSVDLSQLESAQPAIKMRVTCSKGTYIRTLGEDLGELLGCGGHLTALRRIATGGFDVAHAYTLAALEAMTEAQRLACLLPVEALLVGHQAIQLDGPNAQRFLSGLRRRGAWADASKVAVYAEQPVALLGSAHVRGGELIPDRLLNPLEIEQSRAQWQAAGAEPFLNLAGQAAAASPPELSSTL